ncbi:MAG TPA: SDR family oxidoreductase [Myxococcales bacterium]|nr:SDR family oxidoreductase [Myxococcales bacterium]
MSLDSKVALVTGGGRGIGRSIAHELATLGAKVVVTGRSTSDLEEVAEQIGGVAISMDLNDRAQSDQALAQLQVQVGGVDILVNNAGIADAAPIKRTSLDTWDRIFEVNVTAVFRLCKALLPHMTEQGWGRIITIASNAGLTGYGYSAPYCASKHAVIGFTRAMAVDLGTTGVTINAVCPGWVETDMALAAVERISQSTGRSTEKARATLENMSPQRRMISPEEVASMTAMLCGDGARGINGQSLVIDGGQVLK